MIVLYLSENCAAVIRESLYFAESERPEVKFLVITTSAQRVLAIRFSWVQRKTIGHREYCPTITK